MAVKLLLLASCLLPCGRSMRVEFEAGEEVPSSWLENYEAEAARRLSRAPLVEFPTSLESDFSVDKYLGAGSFGESWLVTTLDPRSSMYNQQVVVKLLYLKEGKHSKVPVHLTWRMAKADVWSEQAAREAARECEIAADMHEGQGKGASGAARVMNCFGHNVPRDSQDTSHRLDEPLYLVLENCGGEDLTKFMHRKARANDLSVDLVSSLFKQILEGLEFLDSLKLPWVHHDLKPDNIVVKSHGDGTYSAYLIDFGCTVKAIQDFMCQYTASTPVYAPKEWGFYKSNSCPRLNFEWSRKCPHCGTAFDMFSASAILVELVTGSRLYMLSAAYDSLLQRLDYGVLNSYADNPENINLNIEPGGVDRSTTYASYKNLMTSFLESGSLSASLFGEAMKALRTDAKRRPTASKLLQHKFFGGLTIASTVPALAIPKCPFKMNEVAEVYNTEKQSFDRGTVLSVTDNKVVVQVTGAPVRLPSGTHYSPRETYTMDCFSSRLRRVSSDRKESVSVQSGYRPALGRNLKGFDEVNRISTDKNCPDLCNLCYHGLQSLSSTQFVCWSFTQLNTLRAAKWLYENNCEVKSTYSMQRNDRKLYGYVCNTGAR